jgi:Family of unknown function (DUF6152)
VGAALGSFVLAALATGASAHHPITAKFDPDTHEEISGVVTKVDWRNPHAHLFINVEASGEVLNWAIELESPIDLRANGWRTNTVAPGDHLLVGGPRARDGSRQLWGQTVMRASTRQPLFTVSLDPPPQPLEPRPTPRWSDGKPALGATPTSSDGYWGYPSATALVEDGVDVEMNTDGLLAHLDDARRVAPMQPWALGLYRHRQSRQLQDDPMFLNCKPPGGPRQYQSHLGIKLLEDRANQRIFVLFGSGNHNYRIIYLDGREQVGQVGGDDDNPLYYGRSVGRWDGDTLIVDTVGFNEDFWFTNGGLPHTSFLRMTERFSRPDLDTLLYQVTIDDPGAYTRPWTATWTLSWVGGEELPAHFCQNNRP